jgi:hypothetical protein
MFPKYNPDRELNKPQITSNEVSRKNMEGILHDRVKRDSGSNS